jgi:hypothetical protein
MIWSKWLILLLLLLLAVAYPLAKQLNPGQAGMVEGFVVDEKGAPVPAATVEARTTLHGVVARGACKPDGAYRINAAPGNYSRWAEAKGYSCAWIPQVVIQEGKHTRQDFQLTCELRDSVHAPVR